MISEKDLEGIKTIQELKDLAWDKALEEFLKEKREVIKK